MLRRDGITSDVLEYLHRRDRFPTPSEFFDELPYFPGSLIIVLSDLKKRGIIEYKSWNTGEGYACRIVLQ